MGAVYQVTTFILNFPLLTVSVRRKESKKNIPARASTMIQTTLQPYLCAIIQELLVLLSCYHSLMINSQVCIWKREDGSGVKSVTVRWPIELIATPLLAIGTITRIRHGMWRLLPIRTLLMIWIRGKKYNRSWPKRRRNSSILEKYQQLAVDGFLLK